MNPLHLLAFSNVSKEEKNRKLFILRVILAGIVVLAFTATLVNLFASLQISLALELLPSLVLSVFVLLYLLARRGVLILPSMILIGLLSLLAYYFGYRYGIIIPTNWTLSALSVVAGGILISARFALFLALIHTSISLIFAYLQSNNILHYEPWDITPSIGSVFVASAILVIIGLISWLSNREIEKALQRARKSEAMLRRERDMLEIKVEERTRQIRNERIKQIMELYRFADFGKLAAGLFHDLVDPLSVITLNLENLNHETRHKILSTEGKANIRSALKMVTENQRRVEAYVNSTRKQLQGKQIRTRFDLKAEIDSVIAGLTPKANTSRVSLEFHCLRPLFTYGNPVRFHQLMHNLISNAIDSYDGVKRRKNRIVLMKLEYKEKQSVCSVEDFGCGISAKHLSQIFTPFFTTKPLDKGIGIGLSIAKEIVERDFKGEISVKSRIHKETLFTVQFPLVS